MYVPGCWHENILVANETVRGHIYTSLVAEVQIQWEQVERIKDIYICTWLLEKICSAHKGLNKYQKGDFTSSTVAFYQKSIFNLLNPFTNRLIYVFIYGIFLGSFLDNLERPFFIELWWQKKIIFLQMHNTIL